MHVSNARARLAFRRLGKIYTASSDMQSSVKDVSNGTIEFDICRVSL